MKKNKIIHNKTFNIRNNLTELEDFQKNNDITILQFMHLTNYEVAIFYTDVVKDIKVDGVDQIHAYIKLAKIDAVNEQKYAVAAKLRELEKEFYVNKTKEDNA
jgi:hypothetical protein